MSPLSARLPGTARGPSRRILSRTLAALALAATAIAQETLEQRVTRLEEQNRAMSRQLEQVEFRDVIPPLGDGRHGLGPAASKVYDAKGLSIGGYGEYLFQQRSGDTDVFDALRGVLYFGYKLDDEFVVNTEIEFEHGTTGSGTGTTSSAGSASIEFGYVDWLHSDALNVRAGLLLVPLGWLNELHEPTTFWSASRPRTEQVIIPTTWREGGAGVHGSAGGFAYRAYAMQSLDGEEFDARGFRDGRQKGNRAAADDFAVAARLDWVDTPGLVVGAGVFAGDTGQDGIDAAARPIPELTTTILEAHAEYRTGPWSVRGLYATAFVDDAGVFDAATGELLGDRLEGYYVEAGCDVLALGDADARKALTPFLRFERVDTQKSMPRGFASDPANDQTIWTFGVDYAPIPQLVVKLDFEQHDRGRDDAFNVLLGYVF